jgi:hypothetical protein
MGTLRPGDSGPEFMPGPMAWLVDRTLEAWLGYSVLAQRESDPDALGFVSEMELTEAAKALRPRKAKTLSGYKNPEGTGLFRRNAEMLGARALSDAAATGRPVVAVLFRDGDGTRSSPPDDWQRKLESMLNGFQLAGCTTGVPMLPRPKSEAWLLCALKAQPYWHCAALEEASGNDNSPNSLKTQLDALIGHTAGAEEQAQWVKDGRVDPNRLDMPSFLTFRRHLEAAWAEVSAGSSAT